MNMGRTVVSVCAATALIALGGCKSGKGFQPLDITLQASPDLNQAGGGMKTVEVNIVGVPADNVDIACQANPSKWFSAPESNEAAAVLRSQLEGRGLVKKLTFKTGSPVTQVVPANDPFWKKVKEQGVRDLLIIADPPIGEGGDGTLWRRCIKAESETWVGDRVTVTVGKGVTAAVLLPPKP